ASAALQIAALRQVPATHPTLKLDLLKNVLNRGDADVQIEAVRALDEHPDPRRIRLLLDVVKSTQSSELRASAVVGIAAEAQQNVDELLSLTRDDSQAVRDEA